MVSLLSREGSSLNDIGMKFVRNATLTKFFHCFSHMTISMLSLFSSLYLLGLVEQHGQKARVLPVDTQPGLLRCKVSLQLKFVMKCRTI